MAATRLNLEEPKGQATPTTLLGRTKAAPTCCGDCRYMPKTRSVRLANSWCRKRPSRRRTHRSWRGRSWGWFSHRRSNRFSYNWFRRNRFFSCRFLSSDFLCCWLLGYRFFSYWLFSGDFFCCWFGFLCCYHFRLLIMTKINEKNIHLYYTPRPHPDSSTT